MLRGLHASSPGSVGVTSADSGGAEFEVCRSGERDQLRPGHLKKGEKPA